MGEEASAAEIIQLDSSSPEAPSVPPDVVMIEDDAGGEPAGARAAEEGEGAPEAAENLDDIDGDTAVRAGTRRIDGARRWGNEGAMKSYHPG